MAKEPVPLHGKVVAITGAARGIGLATAKACAARGMKVAIGDLDEAEAKRAAEGVPGAVGLPLDVTDRESFEAFLDAADEQLGNVDVLVNNAGIMQLGPFVDEDDVTAKRQVDINVHGVMYGMKIVLPRFQARNAGHLVNIASSAGKGGFPGGATYCGTKHFVVGRLRGGSRRAARHRHRGLLRDAGRGEHRAGVGPALGPRREERGARGGGRRDRGRPGAPALRRVRAARRRARSRR